MRTTHTAIAVGIDVSKATLDVAIMSNDRDSYVRTCTNTREGILQILTSFKTHGVSQKTPCVLESTGDYHLLCATQLSRAGYTVNCINPLITKQYQRSSVRNAKSDTIDAKRLAEIALTHEVHPFALTESDILARKLVSSLEKLEKVNQLLKRHARHTEESLSQLGIVHTECFDDVLGLIETKRTEIQEKLIACAPREAVLLGERMTGVSVASMAILTTLLGGRSFKSRDSLIAFVGLDVMPRRSGTWVGREKLSKRGNAFARRVLYNTAWGLMQNNPRYRAYYDHLRKRGKHFTECLVALARKFLRFLYAYYWKKSIPVEALA